MPHKACCQNQPLPPESSTVSEFSCLLILRVGLSTPSKAVVVPSLCSPVSPGFDTSSIPLTSGHCLPLQTVMQILTSQFSQRPFPQCPILSHIFRTGSLPCYRVYLATSDLPSPYLPLRSILSYHWIQPMASCLEIPLVLQTLPRQDYLPEVIYQLMQERQHAHLFFIEVVLEDLSARPYRPSTTLEGMFGVPSCSTFSPAFFSLAFSSLAFSSPVFSSPVLSSPVFSSLAFSSPASSSPVFSAPVSSSQVSSAASSAPASSSPVFSSPAPCLPETMPPVPSSAQPSFLPSSSISGVGMATPIAGSLSAPPLDIGWALSQATKRRLMAQFFQSLRLPSASCLVPFWYLCVLERTTTTHSSGAGRSKGTKSSGKYKT
ncbi:hypothetical protein VKT23_017664 [Stygiomarasmius scandens]|uniref:Uncharacterized protein n=1 Tax=Marasmiellus scandens TaxID=2682957 RepID=A0ABR1ITI7_9AGAR